MYLNSSPIDELGKSALGMLEPRYEPQAEHAGIHDNPGSRNHQAPWRYLPPHILTIDNEREGGEGAKALNIGILKINLDSKLQRIQAEEIL